MSYRMINKAGNVIYSAETEADRDFYLKKGYTEEKPNKSSTKRGKNNDTGN